MEPSTDARPRSVRYCQPLLLELAGCMNDDLVNELAGRLRKYRNRYAPILRLMVTLVANNMDESAIFGEEDASAPPAPPVHAHGATESRKRPRLSPTSATGAGAKSGGGEAVPPPSASTSSPLFTRPAWAVTANKTIPVVRRLHAPYALPPPAAPSAANGASTSSAGAAPDLAASLKAAERSAILNDFEHFMSFDFLPLAVTHNRLRAYAQVDESASESTSHPVRDDSAANGGVRTASSAAPFSQADVAHLVLKQYVHDAARTASFLVADRSTRVAALIDPRVDAMPSYMTDLSALGLQLHHIIVTHCFLDGALAVLPLVDQFPSACVWSGVPLSPAGTSHIIPLRAGGTVAAKDASVNDEGVVSLTTVAVPSFSPENLLVELRLRGVLVAVFCGTAWGTDAAPRSDYFASFVPLLSKIAAEEGCDTVAQTGVLSTARTPTQARRTAAGTSDGTEPFWVPASFYDQDSMRVAQANLKTYWYDRYLHPPPPPDATTSAAAELERQLRAYTVVVFPSHGGYSNVTNQLDLYWAIHTFDLKQMQHAQRVVDCLVSPDAYVQFNKRMPPLPRAMLYQSNRAFNLRQLLRAGLVARGAPSPPAPQGPVSFSEDCWLTLTSSPAMSPLPPVMLDVRDQNAYHAHHLDGAINVPMSFPTNAFGAKRAELWLQCVLVPGQPILVLCEDAAQREVVRTRVRSVSPEAAVIAVATLAELLEGSETIRSASCQGTPTSPNTLSLPAHPPACSMSMQTITLRPAMLFPPTAEGVVGADTGCTMDKAAQASATAKAATLFPDVVRWIHYTTPLERLSTVESLRAIEPRPDTLVVDVRTPYEFKNGSHQHSVHYQLCDLCTDTAADTLRQWRGGGGGGNGGGGTSNLVHSAAPAPLTHAPSPTRSFAASPALGGMWVRKLHTDGLVSGLSVEREVWRLHRICFYCAGGYRSLIAESLLERALGVAAAESVVQNTADGPQTLTSAATSLCWLRTLNLVDVPGGAFQIMTQRPDLWRVKDRSIICIS